MGISDEDYANAIEHQRLHERALMKLELQKQQMEKEAKMAGLLSSMGSMGVGAIQPVTGTNTVTLQHNPYSNVSMTQSGSKVLTEEDLKNDAMQAPLSALVDMWTVRYSGEWVSESNFQDDDFWRIALIRLVGANKLEKHHLASQYAAVYRIIE